MTHHKVRDDDDDQDHPYHHLPTSLVYPPWFFAPIERLYSNEGKHVGTMFRAKLSPPPVNGTYEGWMVSGKTGAWINGGSSSHCTKRSASLANATEPAEKRNGTHTQPQLHRAPYSCHLTPYLSGWQGLSSCTLSLTYPPSRWIQLSYHLPIHHFFALPPSPQQQMPPSIPCINDTYIDLTPLLISQSQAF